MSLHFLDILLPGGHLFGASVVRLLPFWVIFGGQTPRQALVRPELVNGSQQTRFSVHFRTRL